MIGRGSEPAAPRPLLSVVAAVSGLYDFVAGAFLLFAATRVTQLPGLAGSPLFAELNALFLIAVGAGYYLPFREPDRYRAFLWIMGVGLKTAGAVALVASYLGRGSPELVLVAAAGDVLLAGATLWALLAHPATPI